MTKSKGIRAAQRAAKEAALIERRANPKTPIDAYRNHMDGAPDKLFAKKRREWKDANPTFEFNGVTYTDHWDVEMSNSGKTPRFKGWLTGSHGSYHLIVDNRVKNRRNDSDRNWGLGRRGNDV